MEKIRINAKSIPKYDNFMAKINSGFHHIEIQLLNEFLSENDYEETRKIIESRLADISIVHTPLVQVSENRVIEVDLMDLLNENLYKIFEDTCKYAEFIAQQEERRIKVIVHTVNSKQELITTKIIPEKIGIIVKNVLNKYKNVDLLVENSNATIEGERKFRAVFGMDDVAWAVKELNEVIGEKRVYPLIDICHLLMDYEAWRRITYEDLLDFDKEFKNATEFDELGLIHLNNIWDNGFDEDHGRPFDMGHEGDIEKLEKVMIAYKKYANCEITIEVSEDDYIARPNHLIATKDSLEKLGYELDCGE